MEKCYACGCPGAGAVMILLTQTGPTPVEIRVDFCSECMALEVKRVLGLRGSRATVGKGRKPRSRKVDCRVVHTGPLHDTLELAE